MAPSSPSTLVPPGRLGVLLRRSRVTSGRSRTELAAAAGLSVAELGDLEQGRHPLDADLLERLVAAYDLDDAGLIPDRTELVIDLDRGRIAAARSELALEPDDGPDAVLVRYLALVYRLRELPIGTPLALRDVDVDVLARALELRGGEIEDRLQRLIDDGSEVADEQRRLRRQLLVPLAGVVVAVTSLGTLVLVASGERSTGPAAESPQLGDAAIEEAGTIPTELGPGGVVEVNPDP